MLDLRAENAGVADGVAVTSISDVSGQGNTGVEGTSGNGPIYRTSAWNGEPLLEFTTGRWLKFTGASLVNAGVGASKNWTVIAVLRNTNKASSTSTYFSWASSTTARYLALRSTTATARHYEMIAATATGVKASVQTVEQFTESPNVLVLRRTAGSGIRVGQDGWHESRQADTVDTTSGDRFAIGALADSSTGAASDFGVRAMLVYNRELTDTEISSVEQWCGRTFGSLSWKARLGGQSAASLIIPVVGQSNAAGNANTTPYWTASNSRAYMLALDGFRKAVYEPFHDATNQIGGVVHTAPPNLGGFGARLADRLRDHVSDDVVIVPCALNSTRADQWQTSASADPPDMATLVGSARERIREALKNQKAKLGPIVIAQGEAEAGDMTSAAADAWDATWAVTFDALNSEFDGRWASPIHFVVIKTATNVTRTFVANVRARQVALAAARTDVVLYEPPGVTENGLHWDTPEMNQIGTDVGDLIFANL